MGGHHIFLEGDLVGSCIPPVPEPTNRPLPYLLRVQYPSLGLARFARAKNAEFRGVAAARLFVTLNRGCYSTAFPPKSINL